MAFMVATLPFAQMWVQKRFNEQAVQQAKIAITDLQEFTANAITTMMLTGVISEREVFLSQLTKLPNIVDVRIRRNKLVIEQFGEGINGESKPDEVEKRVMKTGKSEFIFFEKDGKRLLRGVAAERASHNRLGKDCLACHDVPDGYVNGTISLTVSLEEIDEYIAGTETALLIGQISWQVLVFLVIMMIMSVLLTKPIKEVSQTLKEICDNNDLTRSVSYSMNDELGVIASEVNELLDKLKQDFQQFSVSAEQVSSSSGKLQEASTLINDRSSAQSAKLNDVVASVEEITHTTTLVAKNTADVAKLSETASNAAVDGGEIIQQTIDGIYRIRDTVSSIAETITGLQERSKQIGEITTVIDDIAEQTNLLALNAAIEAARAGEQGRGFAVVADEVRKLAERTSKATQEITSRIQSIQAETTKAAEGMERGQEEVENGVSLAREAGNSLSSIVKHVEDVSSKLANISVSMDEQGHAIQDIAENVSEVASHADDNAKDIQNASEIATELNELSRKLSRLIHDFRF